jgi:cytochrome c556
MSRTQRTWLLTGTIAALTLLLAGLRPSVIVAQEISMEQAEAAIQYRQSVMKAIGGLMGTSVGQLRDGLDYGPEMGEVASALQALTGDIPALFPEGSDFGETDAKPEVWENRKGFEEASSKMREQVDGFSSAVKTGDRRKMLGAFKAMGDACKACHQDFRVKR